MTKHTNEGPAAKLPLIKGEFNPFSEERQHIEPNYERMCFANNNYTITQSSTEVLTNCMQYGNAAVNLIDECMAHVFTTEYDSNHFTEIPQLIGNELQQEIQRFFSEEECCSQFTTPLFFWMMLAPKHDYTTNELTRTKVKLVVFYTDEDQSTIDKCKELYLTKLQSLGVECSENTTHSATAEGSTQFCSAKYQWHSCADMNHMTQLHEVQDIIGCDSTLLDGENSFFWGATKFDIVPEKPSTI